VILAGDEQRAGPGPPDERYAVSRVLGRGGMASVYLARDHALHRTVALKVLSEQLAGDEAFRRRFLNEARSAARLTHPNIVQVYDVGEDERGPFIVMEYVPGGTLEEELRRRGRLPAPEVVAIALQLCAALQAAHAEGLVHRDIAAQNVPLRGDGQVKLADFGIARSLAGGSAPGGPAGLGSGGRRRARQRHGGDEPGHRRRQRRPRPRCSWPQRRSRRSRLRGPRSSRRRREGSSTRAPPTTSTTTSTTSRSRSPWATRTTPPTRPPTSRHTSRI
jgi:serine/threonine protein kinase